MVSPLLFRQVAAATLAVQQTMTSAVGPADLPAPTVTPTDASPVQLAQVRQPRGTDTFGGVRRAPPLTLSGDAQQFNARPTRSRFIQLSERSPGEARVVLTSLSKSLTAASAPRAVMSPLTEMIAADDAQIARLVRSSDLIRAIFPENAADFSSAVSALSSAQLPGWEGVREVPQTAVTGIARSNGQGRVTLDAGGRSLELVTSPRLSAISPNMGSGWLEGFLHDGDLPLTVQGTVSADGKQFRVEGFMPGTSDDFVFGRVQVVLPNGQTLEPFANPPNREVREQVLRSGNVRVATARGTVEVTNPELKAQLVYLPRLGVILPVAPSLRDGKLVIDRAVPDYFALGGRFQASPSQPARDMGNGTYSSHGAAAYDNFRGEFVISGGPGVKYRMENNGGQRNFPFGRFVPDANGELKTFRGRYVSGELGQYNLPQPTGAEGSLLQTAITGSEATVRRTNDFVRTVPAPPASTR
jgi:hypothetical protein